MNHIGHGPQAILAIQHPVFKRNDLEYVFQIRPSTAKNWIKQWLEEGIMETKGIGRNTCYNFRSKGETIALNTEVDALEKRNKYPPLFSKNFLKKEAAFAH
ncbi:MAG: hypothetical protein A2X86_14835 [Bdellovibrionales bacterium GWA2_49_15]|nr:MAG: hypothetical protein A2X86_14835 [Bdellovibrionales bacterium GWA2_49_15]HAZ13383.1 hypothetical protein [Bdellovibrionales bacterium]